MVGKLAKIGIGVALVGGLATFGVFGREAGSYVSTCWKQVKSNVENSVPVSFEIDRARDMLTKLDPEIKRNMQAIFTGESEIKKLDKQIAAVNDQVGRAQGAVLRLKNDLSENKPSYVYCGKSYAVGEVKIELASRFERFKTQEATLEQLKKVKEAREIALNAAQKKLETMIADREQLKLEIEQLEAQQAVVEAAQVASSYNLDDSQLSRTKELVESIRTRLDVEARMAAANTEPLNGIQLDDEVRPDIVEEVTAHFNRSQTPGSSSPQIAMEEDVAAAR